MSSNHGKVPMITTPNKRKRVRMEMTTPNKDGHRPPPSHTGSVEKAALSEARIVWKESPAGKPIRASGTGKLAVQQEMQGFVGRLQRASIQSPPGVQSPDLMHGKAPIAARKKLHQNGVVQSDHAMRKHVQNDHDHRPSTSAMQKSSTNETDPPITRHLLFSPPSDQKRTPPPSSSLSSSRPTERLKHSVGNQISPLPPSAPPSHRTESQDELSILDKIDEKYSEDTSSVKVTTASVVARAFTTPTKPKVSVEKTEFDSPEPLTEESWQLLEQIEYQASQRIQFSHSQACTSPQVLPPRPVASLSAAAPSQLSSHAAPAPVARPPVVTETKGGIPLEQGEEFKRLLVLEVDRDAILRHLTLRLLDDHNHQVEASLQEDWYDSPLDIGDTVNIVFTACDQATGLYSQDHRSSTRSIKWIERITIDNKQNAIILHPDLLVSPTSVTSSFGCLRSAVLKETIRLSAPTHPKALLGTLKHHLFEQALVNQQSSKEFMMQQARKIVASNVLNLVESGVSEDTALLELSKVTLDFEKWIHDAFSSSGVQVNSIPGSEERVRIKNVLATEEMMWSIKWGLKGATDASVEGMIRVNQTPPSNAVIPLELKTGSKVYNGVEHQGQVILYTLLLNERYRQQSQNGLLLYAPGIETNRIEAQASHLRGLILARNRFASSMARVKAIGSATSHVLPPMIQRRRDCERCFQVNECVMHHAAIENGTSDSSGLEDLFTEKIGHLNDIDFAYFKHWNQLIDLEQRHAEKSMRSLWLQSGSKREQEQEGTCIAGLTLIADDPMVSDSGTKRTLGFQLSSRFQRSALDQRFRVDDRVIVSVESADGKKMIAHVTRGKIVALHNNRIALEVNQSIPTIVTSGRSVVGSSFSWRLDKDALMSGLHRAKENLVRLFVGAVPDTQRQGTRATFRPGIITANASESESPTTNMGDVRRRQLIVHLSRPRFKSCRMIEMLQSHHHLEKQQADQLLREFYCLNVDQQRAAQKVLNALDYALVLGMPGTGKTSTIAFSVRVLLFLGYSVLVTSYTHSAVDNLLLKLRHHNLPMLRIGHPHQVHPLLAEYTLDRLIEKNQFTTQAIDQAMVQAKLVGVTCLSVNGHVLFSKRRFDFCIVDEASQITQPVVLGPLAAADTFVLVGDHYQLPPLVADAQARREGMDQSLFRRLSEAHPDAMAQLSYQYRMNQDIMLLSNQLVYGGKLKCGSFAVASNHLKLQLDPHQHDHQSQHLWPWQVLTKKQGVVFLNIDAIGPCAESTTMAGATAGMRRRMENRVEADLVVGLVEILVRCGVPEHEIAVISPFRSQVNCITQHLLPFFQKKGSLGQVEVSTIDKYQGKDKDVILVSFVRWNEEQRVGELLNDWRRINVALTRAKQKLLLIGSKSTLGGGAPLFGTLMQLIDQQQWEVGLKKDALAQLQVVLTSLQQQRMVSEPEIEDDVIGGSIDHCDEEEETVEISYCSSTQCDDIEGLVPDFKRPKRFHPQRSKQKSNMRPLARDVYSEYNR